MDERNFDKETHQRNDVRFDIATGKRVIGLDNLHSTVPLSIRSIRETKNGYQIFWEDGLTSSFSAEWVQDQIIRWKGNEGMHKASKGRTLWTRLSEESFRASNTLTFESLVTDEGMKSALRLIYEYGILLVTNSPIDDDGAGVSVVASAFGGGSVKNSTTILHLYRSGDKVTILPNGTDGPLRTLYGTVWSTSSHGPHGQEAGTSLADSAYGNLALPLHTDMTYCRDPPGLQIFTMVQPAVDGGTSFFADGYSAAERLRQSKPSAFTMLSSTIRRYRSVDFETGWHLEASGPVVSTRNGEVIAVRHNDLDRLPDLPPPHSSDADAQLFYEQLAEAHHEWDSILNNDEFRLDLNLRRGETVVVANQVCTTVLGFRRTRYMFLCARFTNVVVCCCSVVFMVGKAFRLAHRVHGQLQGVMSAKTSSIQGCECKAIEYGETQPFVGNTQGVSEMMCFLFINGLRTVCFCSYGRVATGLE